MTGVIQRKICSMLCPLWASVALPLAGQLDRFSSF